MSIELHKVEHYQLMFDEEDGVIMQSIFNKIHKEISRAGYDKIRFTKKELSKFNELRKIFEPDKDEK